MSGHLVSGGDTSGCAWCHQVTPRVPAPMLWRPVIGRLGAIVFTSGVAGAESAILGLNCSVAGCYIAMYLIH